MNESALGDLAGIEGGGCHSFYVRNETTGELVVCITVYVQ